MEELDIFKGQVKLIMETTFIKECQKQASEWIVKHHDFLLSIDDVNSEINKLINKPTHLRTEKEHLILNKWWFKVTPEIKHLSKKSLMDIVTLGKTGLLNYEFTIGYFENNKTYIVFCFNNAFKQLHNKKVSNYNCSSELKISKELYSQITISLINNQVPFEVDLYNNAIEETDKLFNTQMIKLIKNKVETNELDIEDIDFNKDVDESMNEYIDEFVSEAISDLDTASNAEELIEKLSKLFPFINDSSEEDEPTLADILEDYDDEGEEDE